MTKQQRFGGYLKKLRNTCDMTLRTVEDETGISNSYISQIENGHRNIPRLSILRLLAKCYNINLHDIVATIEEIEER